MNDEAGARVSIIDIHSHVLPGVDDGARDLTEAMAALEALEGQGVTRIVATPHFRASLLERAVRAEARLELFDQAHDDLTRALEASDLTIELGRACEFKLDAPVTDLSDPRLRLDGSNAVLVEFGSFQLPPFAGNQLRAVSEAGWLTVLAHPERYIGIHTALDRVERWVREGVVLQVNARSLSGGYGPGPQELAAEMLAQGWVSCVASDYHSFGSPEWPQALELLRTAGEPGSGMPAGESGPASGIDDWIDSLVYENPQTVLSGEAPKPVAGRNVDLAAVGRGRSRRHRS